MHGLGDLESSVMSVLWDSEDSLCVRDVLERLDTGKDLAYTTVMTVLDNLHRKTWVERERVGRAFYYCPSYTRAEFAAQSLRHVLEASGDPEAVLLHFARSATAEETEVLRKGLRRRSNKR
ncbi:Transcriptional regulator, MecI family [Alloactinosynnema sp. L-07]|uniref:BlaI/MecI/CopY family transcriptional regulator n=1 Tax=Alloactinosynnema sp. L-07 TaxID=1653480 RepID=UPI00065EF5A4|nr:BlaI/MecI/CopY family transcriptional regulator [Alloactinosynnema sp. L-07]CRK55140.1 Transcriptional regulator, MecI family [Alloactinosynnema sp. L-07]